MHTPITVTITTITTAALTIPAIAPTDNEAAELFSEEGAGAGATLAFTLFTSTVPPTEEETLETNVGDVRAAETEAGVNVELDTTNVTLHLKPARRRLRLATGEEETEKSVSTSAETPRAEAIVFFSVFV